MTPQEFKKRLGQLHEVITRGIAYYAIWKWITLHDSARATWSLDQQNQLLDRYRGFFTPLANALLDGTLLQFAKLFDQDPQTASLSVLLRAAKKDATLVPQCQSGEIKKVIAEFKQVQTAVDTLKKKRNEQLAHTDANPTQLGPLKNTDLENLAEKVKSAFNTLSAGHDGNVYIWDPMISKSDRDTPLVFEAILREMDRESAEAEIAIARTRT